MLGIIGAMEVEIDGLTGVMEGKETYTLAGQNYVVGKIFGKSLVVARCGIGKVNASVAACIMIQKFNVDKIINIGVGGGVGRGVVQGDIVVAEKTVYHDYNQTEDGLPLGQVQGFEKYFMCDKATVDSLDVVLNRLEYRHFVGVIASGDQFIADREKSHFIASNFNALACDMESCAINHVCLLCGVKFVSMRAISDNADEKGVSDFYTFLTTAAKRSIEVIKEFIKIA